MKTISANKADGTPKPVVQLKEEIELEVLIGGKVEVDYGDRKVVFGIEFKEEDE